MKGLALAIVLAFQGVVFFALGFGVATIGLPDIDGVWIPLAIIGAAMGWAVYHGIRDGTRAPDPQDWSDKE